jgi:hypothetical protein
MDKKTFTIGILSLCAVILMVANYFAPQPAQGGQTIRDRDFAMVTAESQNGGDVLYILDNVSGRIAIFSYDTSRKEMVPRAGGDLTAVFNPPMNNR